MQRDHALMRWLGAGVVAAVLLMIVRPVWAADGGGRPDSITDNAITLPSMDQLVRVLSLRDHNTRVVVLGVSVLGAGAGIVGTFMLLRKQALLSDAISHATLPGICAAFFVSVALGGSGKSLWLLMVGAAVFGALGMLCVVAISRWSRLKDDVALAIVLSVFFGLGVAMLGIVQQLQEGNAAGLSRFIYGKAASMLSSEANTILIAAAGVTGVCLLLFKEFALVGFDNDYAATQGWPVTGIDLLLMAMVVAVTVIGLQAVGLILVVAMLVIPPAAARFWTDRLRRMTIVAAGIGAASGWLGATASGLMPRLPTGPIIVLVATTGFVVSMLFGVRRGVLVRAWRHVDLSRRIALQHLLRAAYELVEDGDRRAAFSVDALTRLRSWSSGQVTRQLRRARRRGLIELDSAGRFRLTADGWTEARKLVRNHRLWEMYLITYADIAPSHVDRDADAIEHVLGAEMVNQLERLLVAGQAVVPPSPHVIAAHEQASIRG